MRRELTALVRLCRAVDEFGEAHADCFATGKGFVLHSGVNGENLVLRATTERPDSTKPWTTSGNVRRLGRLLVSKMSMNHLSKSELFVIAT